jgi:uncharacterized membrane protein YfcA
MVVVGRSTRVYFGSMPSADKHDKALAKARAFSPGVGFVAGLFGSLIGVGGGVIMNPMILSMCKTIPQRVLVGTSLGAVVSTALASGSIFMSHDSVDLASAAIIATSAMTMAPFGARLTTRLDCRQLRQILAYFLFCAAPLVPIKSALLNDGDQGRISSIDGKNGGHRGKLSALVSSVEDMITKSPLSAMQMVAIGGVAGTFSGLLGIGGGTIVTPLLAITTNIDHSTILGTSLVAMIFPSVAGLVTHYRLGNVDPKLLGGLFVGTGAGGILGSHIVVSPNLPPGTLETLFCLGMLFLARKTLASIK